MSLAERIRNPGLRSRVMTADEAAAHIQQCVDAGADYIIVYLAGLAHNTEMVGRFAQEVMTRFA